MRRGVGAMALLALAACGGTSVDTPVVDARGTVAGVVFLDVDGSGTLSGGDVGVAGIPIRARSPNGEQSLATDVTAADGSFRLLDVPVGSVLTEVDPVILGDSLEVVSDAAVTVAAGDTAYAPVGVTYPLYEIADLRSLPAGRSIFTAGVVLNGPGEAPGGAFHIEAGGRALRVLARPDQTAAVGDSVRVQGRTASDLGQTALRDARIFRVDPFSRAVLADGVTASAARTADVGRLDADLVELISGTVVEVDATSEGTRLTVQDETGVVDIRLRTAQGFTGGVEVGSTVVSLVGLLVHDPSRFEWLLVPRSSPDVALEDPVEPPDRRDDDKGKKGNGNG